MGQITSEVYNQSCMLTFVDCTVTKQLEPMNSTELNLKYNGSASVSGNETSEITVETYEVLCAPPVTNKLWQMASGYIGAALMLVMSVYARCRNFNFPH